MAYVRDSPARLAKLLPVVRPEAALDTATLDAKSAAKPAVMEPRSSNRTESHRSATFMLTYALVFVSTLLKKSFVNLSDSAYARIVAKPPKDSEK